MILMSGGKGQGKGLRMNELDKLNQSQRNVQFDDQKSTAGNKDDLRSVRSEFDYGSKRNFTDILGKFRTNNLNKKIGINDITLDRNTLKRLNGETDSVKSYKSMTSSYRKRLNSIDRVDRFRHDER